jgi:hypothetical protein
VPGQVGGLTLTPFPHNINVNWNRPITNGFCVTHYVILWVDSIKGRKENRIVGSEENSFVIEELDTCVVYEVSVRAVTEKNWSAVPVTQNIRTEAVGNYHAQIILLYL